MITLPAAMQSALINHVNIPAIICEVFININGVNIDITERVNKNKIKITQAVNIETQGAVGKTNDINIVCDNSDGYFSPLNPSSIFHNVSFLDSTVFVNYKLTGIAGETQQFIGYLEDRSAVGEGTATVTLKIKDKYKAFLANKLLACEFDEKASPPDNTFVIEADTKKLSWWFWALLTGYDYDTNTKLSWFDTSMKLDNTKSTDNIHIDYTEFLNSADVHSAIQFTGTRGIYENISVAESLDEILKGGFGYIFWGRNTGKLKWVNKVPAWNQQFESLIFADDNTIGKNNLYAGLSFSNSKKNQFNNIIIKYNYNYSTEKYEAFYVLSNTSVIKISGQADGMTASRLIDSSKNFIRAEVLNYKVYNITDDTETNIIGIEDDNTLILEDNIFVSGENYIIYSEKPLTMVIESKFLTDNLNVSSIASSLLLRYNTSLSTVQLTATLESMIIEPNDYIRVNDAVELLENRLFQVLSISIDPVTNRCNLTAFNADYLDLLIGERWGFLWDIHAGDTNGNTGDPSLEYLEADFDGDLFNAQTFAHLSDTDNLGVEIGSTGIYIKYIVF
jgi:hypothetical protein